MTIEVRVERLSPDDWATWRDLRLRALADAPDAFGRTLAEEREYPDDLWAERAADPLNRQLVATVDGEPAGIVGVRLNPEDAAEVWIFSMWVDPSLRRRRLGHALLDHALVAARTLGASSARLTVTVGNDGAYDLYARAGFEVFGEREPLREGSDREIVWMRRALT